MKQNRNGLKKGVKLLSVILVFILMSVSVTIAMSDKKNDGAIGISKEENESFDPYPYVFARGTDNAIWYRTWNDVTFGNWNSAGGKATSDPDVHIYSVPLVPYNTHTIFVRGTDSALWYRSFDGTSWDGWTSLGGIINSGPGAS